MADHRDEQGILVDKQSSASVAAVRLVQVGKSYGLKPLLRRLNLVIPQGQRVALLGANGAGKTTIIRILAGLLKPDRGQVWVLGRDMQEDAQEIRRCVGLVAHQPYLYEDLTVVENLRFFARVYAVPDAQERIDWLLQQVGLERRAKDRTRILSRGLLQRVAWARALLHRPHLLLLDEPETGLDQTGLALIDDLLAEHSAQGGSVIFSTHQIERAYQQSDRIIVLLSGRIAFDWNTSELSLEELEQRYREVVGP